MLAKFKEMSRKIDENDKKLKEALESSMTTASNLKHMKDSLHDGHASGNLTGQNSHQKEGIDNTNLTLHMTPFERHVKFQKPAPRTSISPPLPPT